MSTPPALPESLVFILGCQRSGTTWLANIFDASPDALLFMEPFSPPYGIFPEFPHPSTFLEVSTPELQRLLRVEMPVRLMRHKTLLFPRAVARPRWFRLERWVAQKGRRFIPPPLRKRLDKFTLLNLNRFDDSFPLYPKSDHPNTWVIKELRFAGKILLLLEALPEVRLVVIIRHPCATVHSILNWFERGRLGELREQLDTYIERLEAQPVGAGYRDEIAMCRRGSLAHTVALYWRVSYETMVRQIERAPNAELLIYERLASQPRETVVALFGRLGIPWSNSIEEYISYSTSAHVEAPGPITTRRESASYYRSWVDKIPDDVRRAVLDVTRDSGLMSYFDPYYNKE